jgi:cell shape-determining protein MreD
MLKNLVFTLFSYLTQLKEGLNQINRNETKVFIFIFYIFEKAK